LNEAGDDEASFAKIKEAEAIVELIKTEYTKLQAQGERIETDARAVITSLNSQKEKILALKEAARRVELDTTILEALEAELYALEEEANSLLSQGKNAEALLKIDEAKAKFEALKVEYSRLLIGVKSI
jgi:chromosome segregation ATPase